MKMKNSDKPNVDDYAEKLDHSYTADEKVK